MSANIFPLKDFHDDDYGDTILFTKFPKLTCGQFFIEAKIPGDLFLCQISYEDQKVSEETLRNNLSGPPDSG